MAIRKPTRSRSTPRTAPKAAPRPASRLQNLAARTAAFDDALDEQLVDHSGVFRVTTAIRQAQTGHEDDDTLLRASTAREGSAAPLDASARAPGPEPADEERVIERETQKAERRARLATLAARARQQAVKGRQARTRR